MRTASRSSPPWCSTSCARRARSIPEPVREAIQSGKTMRIMRLVLGLTAVALLAGPALAQRQQPMRQQSLLANKSVQEELKLTEDQVKKATEVDKTIGDKRTEEM